MARGTLAGRRRLRMDGLPRELYHRRNVAQLVDADGTTGHAYGAKTTPHIIIIDAQGKIAYNGAIDDDTSGRKADRTNYVLAAIDALLAGQPLAVSTTQPYGCSVKYK